MKYALLIYSSPELRDIPEDQLKTVVGEEAFASGHYERAAALIDKITTGPDFETFITLPAYREIN